jgi:hypothetical protein
MTSLYKQLKEHLPKGGAILSDKEFIMLNRKDYNINQLAPVQAILESLNITVGYPFRVLLSFIDSLATASKINDFNIILSDPSMAVAAYVAWVRCGGSLNKGKIFAPKGIPKFPSQTGIVGDMLTDFSKSININPKININKDIFTFVIGNTKTASQTAFAATNFSDIKKGVLILKDFARTDAQQEREYMEELMLFPTVTFEGHGYIIRY